MLLLLIKIITAGNKDLQRSWTVWNKLYSKNID